MTVRFSATRLAGTGKRGILTPDADGYYTMPVGGLNVYNSAGEYYKLDGAKHLFDSSSVFMRRIKSGCLKGEVGHPKQIPGTSYKDYVRRIFAIEETNICAHFKEIWLDETYGIKNPHVNNPNLTAIMAKVKPSGAKGAALEASLKNPDENVCFSIRAVTKDYYERGQCYRVLDNIVTFDWVNEPGIAIATKWDSPALENLSDQILIEEIVRAVAEEPTGFAMESSTAIAREVLRSFAPRGTKPQIPSFSKW